MPLHINSHHQIERFVDDGLVLTDFDNNTIKIHSGIDRIEWPRLPLGNLLNNRFGNPGD
jgi:hypothetical protein